MYKEPNRKFLLALLLFFLLFLFCERKTKVQNASEAIKRGEYARAIRSLKSALTQDSLNPEIHYNLALAYALLDSLKSSYPHFLKLIELNSPLKDSSDLILKLSEILKVEPYPSSYILMERMNQFKGSFSHDNENLAVAAARLDRADIYLIKIDGTIIKRITRDGMNTDPAFSPLKDIIAYVSNRDGDDEIYLFYLNGDSTIKLTNNTYTDISPSFSPDGKEIVYVTNRDGNWEIYKINLKNRYVLRLTNNRFWDCFPSFTPEGKFIIFSSKRNGSEDIYIMNNDGTNERLLYATKYDETDPHFVKGNLIFRSNMDGEFEIYQLNVGKKKPVRLTYNDYPDWNPRVSYDGTKIIASRYIKGRWRLYFINLNRAIPAEVLARKITESKLPQ